MFLKTLYPFCKLYKLPDFKHNKDACQSHIFKFANQTKKVAHTSVNNQKLKEEAIKWRRISRQLSCEINQDG